MPECLHAMLLLLTLLDLAFVAVTGAVPELGLTPLLLLACAAPWLRRLQRHTLYRAIWNTGVLIVFAMLVHHASTSGLLHMLEDGMLLAVLCQVHLLNNVGARQRPDLVFFNSFLIAFVTSFFASSVSWSVLFVAHAFVFVPALQINVLARRGAGPSWSLTRALLRDSVPRTAVIGLGTALLFVFFPRDFHHEGWLGSALARRAALEAGLAEVIDLSDDRKVELGNRVVMRIRALGGDVVTVPTHWRGIAFTTFDGSAWHPQDSGRFAARFATDPTWERSHDGKWRNGLAPTRGGLDVQLPTPFGQQLPLPPDACELTPIEFAGVLLDPKSFGGFAYYRVADAPNSTIRYTVRLTETPASESVSSRVRDLLLQLPDREVVRQLDERARQLRAELPADATPEQIAEHSTEWLRRNRSYRLPGTPGFAGDIENFATGSGGGHCEFFATALGILLRLQEVPCRLIGGYLAQEVDDEGTVVVRTRHAHAWVEALLPDGSWSTFDATPASASITAHAVDQTWWQATFAELEAGWNAVVGFDEDGRRTLVVALTLLPRSIVTFTSNHPLGALTLLALPLALLYARRRRRRRPAAVTSLLAAARAIGLEFRRGETPRELLERARAAAIATDATLALAEAVDRHEHNRYATTVR
ncbi:MAG: DUF3488 domain-containing protein [Planctomycetes bacterium]|nr:DUF3488 domain-containing protein [Planctomycetota bacterium]